MTDYSKVVVRECIDYVKSPACAAGGVVKILRYYSDQVYSRLKDAPFCTSKDLHVCQLLVGDALRYRSTRDKEKFGEEKSSFNNNEIIALGALLSRLCNPIDALLSSSTTDDRHLSADDMKLWMTRVHFGEELLEAFSQELENGKFLQVHFCEIKNQSHFVKPKAHLKKIFEVHPLPVIPEQMQLQFYPFAKELQRGMTLPADSIQNRVTVTKAVDNFQELEALKEQYPDKAPFGGESQKQFWVSGDKDDNKVLVLM